MMPAGKIARMAARNALRSPRHFALSAFGIVVGIASFVFFLSLSMGVQSVILGEIFPIEQVEVVPPKADFLGVDWQKNRLDDAVVTTLRGRRGVAGVVPRMTVAFPASGFGRFEGRDINFEVGGFCDGIDPSFVADEEFAALFQDFDAPERPDAPEGERAQRRAGASVNTDGARLRPCRPDPGNACDDSDMYYCDESDRMCHHRVPVIVSQTLLEIYNSQIAGSHALPRIDGLAQFIAKRGLRKMRFSIGLGDTMVAGSNQHIPASKRRTVEGLLVGISRRAMPIGMTVPIQYVERWNREFAGEEAATSYSSLVVTLTDKDDVAPFAAWLEETLNLRLEDSMGERFATAIFIVTTLFILISFVIVSISAINIAHNFFMQMSERRREIGILRAVGATRRDIRVLVLCEAALIGIIGGVVGVVLSYLASRGVDLASRAFLPAFPFKPETYFDFQPWIVAGGLGFAILFCVLGGYLPARRAALMEPARALAQQ